MSAITKSQVIAFVLCGFVSLLFVMAGFPLVLDLVREWLPLMLIDMVASLSFLKHFNAVSRGVFSLQDFLYFISMIVVWLGATSIVLDIKKGV
jgi:ABC-2 type transport system permease protein